MQFKTIIKGAGVNHVVEGVKIPGNDNITIFNNGNNVSTLWNNTIINNTRYNYGREYDDDDE